MYGTAHRSQRGQCLLVFAGDLLSYWLDCELRISPSKAFQSNFSKNAIWRPLGAQVY